jgi:FtsP/CotA-like multicopper oxidase with cupredoxin domain/peroxiredoxin
MRASILLAGVAFSGLLAATLLPIPLAGQTRQPERERFDPLDKKSVLKSDGNCVEPPLVCSGRSGLVSATLEVKFAHHYIDEDKVWLRTYNGNFPGPTLRVRPGDKLRVKLKNSLPAGESLHPPPDTPGAFNWTNLHTHGLHVSPIRPSDDVLLHIGPGSEYQYEFQIPPNHPCGTFWYHAHHHGSVALQLSSGMAGALIVYGSGLDEVPEIKAARDKIMLFQQIAYRMNAQGVGEVLDKDVYGTGDPNGCRFQTTINGVLAPVIQMAPGEVQRWRLIHAGLEETLALGIIDSSLVAWPVPFREIAVDGLATGTIKPLSRVVLQPANRSEVLVKAPTEAGVYFLINGSVPADVSIKNRRQELKYLAKIVVQGNDLNMPLPAPEALKKCKPFEHLKADSVVAKRSVEMTYDGTRGLMNGVSFSGKQDLFQPKLGTVEEWTLVSNKGLHPFHMHVNPFEVIEVDPRTGEETGTWHDTVVVRPPAKNAIKIRIRFDDFPGRTVMHCHNLPHEDVGMMMPFEIVGTNPNAPAPLRGLGAMPTKAPHWELCDATGGKRSLSDYAGKPVVLVFFQGVSCPHCMEQWQLLAKKRKEFADAGITVLGICPDKSEDLKKALTGKIAEILCFPVFSDADLAVFHKFGCARKEAYHGTFVIDARGVARWQNVGEEPFMDIDAVLAECKRLEKDKAP